MQTENSSSFGDALLGRVLNVDGNAIDRQGDLAGYTRKATPDTGEVAASAERPTEMQETGIKVIDLFAPLVRGGSVYLVGPEGIGLLVTLGEWVRRLATRHRGCLVYVAWHERDAQTADLVNVWRKQRNMEYVVTIIGTPDDLRKETPQALHTGRAIAQGFVQDGREVVFAVATPPGVRPPGWERWSQVADEGSVTLALVDIERGEGQMRDDRPITTDSTLVFDVGLAQRQQYPAINAVSSRSRLLETSRLTPLHRHITDVARVLLATNDPRASLLRAYLKQPYYIAEPYTGVPGEYIPIATALEDMQRIVAQ